MRRLSDPHWLVVHCTGTSKDEDIGVAELRHSHMQAGCGDVAYQYVIRRDGTLETGRPEDAVGAHSPGFNHHSIAVALVGGRAKRARKPEANFTPSQYVTLEKLIGRITAKWPDIEVLGYRDLPGVNGNANPSFDVREWLRRINEDDALHPQD